MPELIAKDHTVMTWFEMDLFPLCALTWPGEAGLRQLHNLYGVQQGSSRCCLIAQSCLTLWRPHGL